MKKTIAVFVGGRSPEHDVSVVTGLQALDALDKSQFEAFLVYVSLDGRWFVGDSLNRRETYIPGPEAIRHLSEVTLDVKPDSMGRGRLIHKKTGLFGAAKIVEFDVALLAFHGLFGEDGGIQGLFEVAGVAYTGMRVMASSLLMDKAVTKYIAAAAGVPMLPFAVIDRPELGALSKESVAAMVAGISFPMIIKPVHLGSSVGVAKVHDVDEILAVLPSIFKLDYQAIVEPFVENLVEYNVAVTGALGGIKTSAIERPKRSDELLDFKQKYMSGGGKKMGGQKAPGSSSEGMLSLTRDINPELPNGMEGNIRAWAGAIFRTLLGAGAPRLDFLSNEKTGEVWFNEANPCPGSLGFFLWEAAQEPVLYSEFLTALIIEAQKLQRQAMVPADPTLVEARLFPRPYNS